MIAVTSGKEDIGVRLLEAGATFEGELSYRKDYLQYAAANGHGRLVRALIEHGADVAASGSDALCFAIENRGFEAARVLIDAGVDVNKPGDHSNDLPIIHAVRSGNLEFVQMLVESGAEVNRKDKAGRVSVMYRASQTGLPSIVSYLVENGAVMSELELDQLLNSAIYKGSMEMVDTFTALGATISSTHLFYAVSQRQYDMADAFLDVIGPESLDDYLLDTLIDQAKSSGHEGMVDELLDVAVSRDDPSRLRLLFEAVEVDGCTLNTWNPRERTATQVALASYPCDAGLFTARRQSTLFVLQGERIDVHSLDNQFPTFSLTLPTRGIEAYIDELKNQFAQWHGGSHDWVTAKVATIGYLDDGRITVITHSDGPADGTYGAQFAWDGNAWTLVDKYGCGRFDWICHKPGVDGQSVDRWPLRRAAWHAALQRNPAFLERIVHSPTEAYGEWRSTVRFDFSGTQSELDYELSGSDHCDGPCTFTDAVTIKPDGTEPIRMVLARNRVSIADRFILMRPVNRNTRLYDLGTGEDVLGDIGRATWIQ